jgi:alpha-L-fucosidase
MQYFVITSKHHDGFALFKSEADPFNVVDAPPFGRDIIGELAESCYKHGLKFGLYYSQELDWHDPDGGGYTNPYPCSGVSWHNSWDFGKSAEGKDFSRCFERKIKPQVKEILTKYGDLCLIWFDTPHTITPEQSLELFDMVKQYQPDCLINSRLGNGAYDYVSLGDNEIPSKLPDKMPETKEGDMNDLGGFKYSPYGLYETAATLNDSWGFKYFDQNWKNAEKVYKNKKHLNDMGINYLLNVGPDALGRIPSFSVDILRGAAELEKNEQ